MAKQVDVCKKVKTTETKHFEIQKGMLTNDAKYIYCTCLEFSIAKELLCATFNFTFVF